MRHKILIGFLALVFILPHIASAKPIDEPVVGNAAGALTTDRGPVVLVLNAPRIGQKEWVDLSRRDEPVVKAPNDKVMPDLFRASVDNSWHRDFTGKQPSIVGMAELRCSGSAEFSVGNWYTLFEYLRSRGGGDVTVVDLREEAHGLVNNMAVSWYTPQDAINRGLSADEVMSAETDRLELLEDAGVITVSRFTNKSFNDVGAWRTINLRVRVKEVQSEYELVSGSDCGYFRITAPHFRVPEAGDVDRFVSFVQGLYPGTWLHFHCSDGQGRTTTFMVLYDMMRNYKKVSADDIIRRQYLLGGIDLTAVPTQMVAIKQEWAKERTVFLREFYQYCQAAGPHYSLSWSAWQAQKSAAPKSH